jgi:peroxiredoxin
MNTIINSNNKRLQELESQFQSLENQIQDTPVKKALSVLHAIFQEGSRNGPFEMTVARSENRPTLQDIAALYRQAPKMDAPAKNTPLDIGVKAPEFKLPNANGQLVGLSDFKDKQLLLVFYPLDWSPGCSQQLDLYQQELAEFEKRGVQIIGLSVDSIYSHGAWAAVRGVTFPLLSDFHPKGEVAKKYQVFREEEGFTERALYLIDQKGIIQYSYVSPFLHHVPDIYELYKKIDELQ